MERAAQIRRLRAELKRQYNRDLDAEYAATFESLERDEAAVLAREVLLALDGHDKKAAQDARYDLLRFACLNPGSLNEIHLELIRRDILYPGALYLAADSDVTDQLIRRLKNNWRHFVSGQNSSATNHLLQCLAWIGDEAVCVLFREWRKLDRRFKGLFIAPWDYASTAGWELDENGQRRDLISKAAFALRRPDESDHANQPLEIVLPQESNCGWCGRQLRSLFNLDLSDSRIASVVGITGERLRIAMCDHCMGFGVTYTDVNGSGESKWSPTNVRPEYLPDDYASEDYFCGFERALILGHSRRSPYGTHLFVHGRGNSQFGGFATWLQDAEHPLCTGCKKRMFLIGQIEWSDIKLSEGVTYAFLCRECGVAATSYQQT